MAAQKSQKKIEPEALVSYRHAFGLTPSLPGSLHFFEESQFIYPCGHCVAIYYSDQRSQRFFPSTLDGEITAITVSPNKKYLAVAESCSTPEGKPQVCIYDLASGKRRRTLSLPDLDCPEITSLAFDTTAKYLLTQYGNSISGKNSWTLVAWAWDKRGEKQKSDHGVIAITKLGTQTINEVSFNPVDSLSVLCIGDGAFKFLKLLEADCSFRVIPYQLAKLRGGQNYVCHVWLQDDRLVTIVQFQLSCIIQNPTYYRSSVVVTVRFFFSITLGSCQR